MSSEEKTCILIVGAGPVGLSLAVMLKQMDVPFRIIDKKTELSVYSRAFSIQSRTLEIFSQLKILETIKSNGRVNTFCNNIFKNGNLIFSLKFPPSESSEPYTVGLIQSKTEEILGNRLKDLGVVIEQGIELKSLQMSGQDVEYAEVEKLNGDKEKIYTSFLIGCDGGRSNVRKFSGIPFTGESVPIRLSCIDAEVETDLSKEKFASMFFCDSRIVLVIWIDNVTARIVIPNMLDEDELDLEKALEITRRNTSPHIFKILKTNWFNTFNINERRAESHYRGNVYLCGDAAHVHSPAGGQGMNTGIQDAYNLAWKLAFIYKNLGNHIVLSQTFHKERAAVAEMVLKNSGAMSRRVFSRIDLFTNFCITYIYPIVLSFDHVKKQNANYLAEVLIKYEQNDLIRDTDSGWIYSSKIPGVGLRLPPFSLFGIMPSGLKNTHEILSGGHCFEIFLYIPEAFFEMEKLDQLRATLSLAKTSPTLLRFKSKSKHSTPYYQLQLIIATKMFQPDQWAHQFDYSSIEEIHKFFKSTDTYLDQNNEFGNYFKFTQHQINLCIVRPDAVIGLAMPTTPERCQSDIEDYFKRFIIPDY